MLTYWCGKTVVKRRLSMHPADNAYASRRLFYQSAQLFIEEPEQNLYPESQKLVIMSIVRSLKKKLPEMPIEYVDERFTSVLAHHAMLEGGLKKKDRRDKALVDEISATIILRDYLESRRFLSGV